MRTVGPRRSLAIDGSRSSRVVKVRRSCGKLLTVAGTTFRPLLALAGCGRRCATLILGGNGAFPFDTESVSQIEFRTFWPGVSRIFQVFLFFPSTRSRVSLWRWSFHASFVSDGHLFGAVSPEKYSILNTSGDDFRSRFRILGSTTDTRAHASAHGFWGKSHVFPMKVDLGSRS